MTWQVFFIEGVVVNLDLGESSEVVRHEHDGHIDVLQLPARGVTPHLRCGWVVVTLDILCFEDIR